MDLGSKKNAAISELQNMLYHFFLAMAHKRVAYSIFIVVFLSTWFEFCQLNLL